MKRQLVAITLILNIFMTGCNKDEDNVDSLYRGEAVSVNATSPFLTK